MIDLRTKGLPNSINVGGKSYLLYTDFREWLKFGEMLKDDSIFKDFNYIDLFFVIKDDVLAIEAIAYQKEFLEALINFYNNKNSTPIESADTSNDIVWDYIQDGEYIVSSFMSQYNIDLTSCDMHWHMFKALFIGLNESTIMSQIMGFRSYKKDNKSYEKQCQKLKNMWSLPKKENKNTNDILKEIREEFYNT